MQLVTARGLIRGVYAAWTRQYKADRQDVAERLLSIDFETATADDIEAIIGNRSWTNIRCNECGKEELEAAVHFDDDDEYSYIRLCRDCIDDAAALLRRQS